MAEQALSQATPAPGMLGDLLQESVEHHLVDVSSLPPPISPLPDTKKEVDGSTVYTDIFDNITPPALEAPEKRLRTPKDTRKKKESTVKAPAKASMKRLQKCGPGRPVKRIRGINVKPPTATSATDSACADQAKQPSETPTCNTQRRFTLSSERVVQIINVNGYAHVGISDMNWEIKRVRLSMYQWGILCSNTATINEIAKNFNRGKMQTPPREFRLHIGSNWHVSLTEGVRCVDIREWWLHAGILHPTRNGIGLRLHEWAKLMELIPQMLKALTNEAC